MSGEAAVIRVLVVDDDPLAVSGIVGVLAKESDISVVGTASGAEEGIASSRRLMPDVVLMDLRMPGRGGIGAIEELVNGFAPPRVISLTVVADDATVIAALKAGSHGYILKDRAPEDLAGAVRTVVRGHAMLSPQVTSGVIARSVGGAANAEVRRAKERLALLTDRELEIVAHIALGESNQEIADALYISHSTVKSAINTIMVKLDAVNRTQVAVLAAYASLER